MDSGASAKSAEQTAAAPLAGSLRIARGYPREAKLLKTADYRRVYDNGSRRQFGWTAAFLLATGDQSSRVGITVPRHFGKAVDRNRIKRRLRSAIAECKSEMPVGWDIVLHPRQAGLKLEYGEVIATLRKIFAYCTKQGSK
jgi:ribonuclease P protein component